METGQIMERLLEKIDANKSKAVADRQHMQEMQARMDANTKAKQESMDAEIYVHCHV
jgi:hypothetical protein